MEPERSTTKTISGCCCGRANFGTKVTIRVEVPGRSGCGARNARGVPISVELMISVKSFLSSVRDNGSSASVARAFCGLKSGESAM